MKQNNTMPSLKEKPLNQLLTGLTQLDDSRKFLDASISGISLHAGSVCSGNIFVAIPGNKFDGHDFIPEAVKNGAAAIISNGRDIGELSIPQIRVANPRRAASWVASEFFDHPSRELTMIGITGTNGKTSTATLVASILDAAGYKTAQMGTLGLIAQGNSPQEKTLTTLDQVALHKSLFDLKKDGFTHIVMEVSSHALQQCRVTDVDFNIAAFTNLTPEHLDYHGNMEEYYHAKAKLFKMLPITATAVINNDDIYGGKIISESSTPILTTSISTKENVHYSSFESTLNGITGDIKAGDHSYKIQSSLIGSFNLENILTAVGIAHAMGIPPHFVIKGIDSCKFIPGRMEMFKTPSGGTVIIDYAHTPDSYEKVLGTICKMSSGKMTVIFGAGGNRDVSKRPTMAAIAEKFAEQCFITPDNPRFDNPQAIQADIVKGFTRKCYTVFSDRGKAIRAALTDLKKNDILAVLGKGRENYQEIRGEKIPYSDVKIIQEFCDEN